MAIQDVLVMSVVAWPIDGQWVLADATLELDDELYEPRFRVRLGESAWIQVGRMKLLMTVDAIPGAQKARQNPER